MLHFSAPTEAWVAATPSLEAPRPRSQGLTHVTPTRIGPLGGSVLLLHGEGLPFAGAITGEYTFRVGNATCPFLARRSDPKGSFLACGPVPAMQARDVVKEDRPVGVQMLPARNSNGQRSFSCSSCRVTYTSKLRADASLALTHRRGVAGDVVTLVGLGLWPHLAESHGHHEQVTATVGEHDALPRYPSSSAVARAADGYPWRLELVLPETVAGQHSLRVSLDRLWHDEQEVSLRACLLTGPSHIYGPLPASLLRPTDAPDEKLAIQHLARYTAPLPSTATRRQPSRFCQRYAALGGVRVRTSAS